MFSELHPHGGEIYYFSFCDVHGMISTISQNLAQRQLWGPKLDTDLVKYRFKWYPCTIKYTEKFQLIVKTRKYGSELENKFSVSCKCEYSKDTRKRNSHVEQKDRTKIICMSINHELYGYSSLFE